MVWRYKINKIIELKLWTISDIFLILVLISGGFFIIPHIHSTVGDTVVITVASKHYAEYPLDINKTISVQGEDGPVVVRIFDGSVSIIEAKCSHQICVRTGSIKNTHQHIVCAPNKIMVEIISKSGERQFDAVTQ